MFGVISAPRQSNDRARERVLGITDAMSANGISPNTLRLTETRYSIDAGAEAFIELMAKPDKPSVVMCGNDVLAVGALQGAKKIGVRVPEDVSVTGFDDIELASITDPQLTTVHVPHKEMGMKAAQILIDMVAGSPPQPSIELATRLCIRQSLGAFALV